MCCWALRWQLDAVSRPEAYADLHGKLMRSYGMDALVRRKDPSEAPSTDAAQAFLDAIAECRERRFPSVGMGEDCRYEARNVVGSILDVDACAVHAAFFGVDGGEDNRPDESRMASYRRRREFHSQILSEDHVGEEIMPEQEGPYTDV